MASVTYTALRSIMAGHSAGTDYTIDFNAQVLDQSFKSVRNRSQSLGGQTESLLVRQDVFWDVTTSILEQSDLAQWKEFLHSVAAGESFTFDAYGTSASPNDPISVERDDDGYAPKRENSAQLYTISFKVREL